LKLKNRLFSAVILLCILSSGWAALVQEMPDISTTDTAELPRRAVFLPELHMSADISRFLLPKNAGFMKDYFLESEIFIEPVWFSARDFFYFITSFEVNANMGQKRFENVLFDPRAVNFALTTVFEFRPRFAILQIGEDHRCFHQIDRFLYPTVYWNMLYLAVGSPVMRPSEFGRFVIGSEVWTLSRRLAWHVRWGVFLKGFFGLVTDSNVDYENNRVHEMMAWTRYAVFAWRKCVFSVSSNSRIGLWEAPASYGGNREIYWQQTMGAEAAIYRGHSGCMLFVNYILDAIPDYPDRQRFSKDRLLEAGVKVFL